MTRSASTIWTFAITSIALFMVSLDNLVVSTAIPVIRVDLRRVARAASSGRSTPTRSPSPCCCSPARRSATASAGGACSRSASASSRSAPSPRRSHRPSRSLNVARAVQGLGGAIVMPLTLTILSRRRAGGAARARARRLGRRSAAWRSPSARSSAAPSSRASRGSGSSGSTSRSGSCWCRSPLARLQRVATGRRASSTSRASASSAPACSGSSGASSAATSQGWTSPEIVAAFTVGALFVAAFVALGAAHAARRCSPMRFFRNAHVLAREPRLAVHVLRDVRLDLPARAVLPDRAGVLAARARGCGSSRGRSRRCSSRRSRGRCPTGSTRSASSARASRCRRSRSAGSPSSRRRRRRTRELIVPFVDRRRRHGALLRADGERRALAPCGPRRRGRRRAPTTRSASSAACSASPCWRRSSRTRRLRDARDVRRRDDAARLRRRHRRRPRRGRRVRDSLGRRRVFRRAARRAVSARGRPSASALETRGSRVAPRRRGADAGARRPTGAALRVALRARCCRSGLVTTRARAVHARRRAVVVAVASPPGGTVISRLRPAPPSSRDPCSRKRLANREASVRRVEPNPGLVAFVRRAGRRRTRVRARIGRDPDVARTAVVGDVVLGFFDARAGSELARRGRHACAGSSPATPTCVLGGGAIAGQEINETVRGDLRAPS